MSESVQHGRRPWAISEIAAWVVIAIAVAIVMWSVIRRHTADALEKEGIQEPKMQTVLSARYVVGINELIKMVDVSHPSTGPAGGTLRADVRQLLESIEKEARKPEDRFRAAIVRGDVAGKESALERLQELEGSPPPLDGDIETVRKLYDGQEVDAKQMAQLKENHGFFAQLAAAYGKPESDPARAAVVSAAMRTLGGIAVILAFVGSAGLLGLALIVVAIILFTTGKLRLGFGHLVPLPADRRTYVQGFALFISCYVGGSLILRFLVLNRWELPDLASAIIGLAVLVLSVVAGLLWPIFRRQRWQEWKAATGFHLGRGLFREIFSGWLGYVTGFPLLVAGALVTVVLVKLTNSDTAHPIMKELGGGPVSWTCVFLLATVWAPITEELMFRGMLFASLRERFGWWISAPIVALVFAAIHPQGWAAIPALGAIAIVLAAIREWRGSVIGCMAAHALHNGVAVIVATMMLT